MLFNISILIAIVLCVWSLYTKKYFYDYLLAIVMTTVFAYLMAQRVSLLGTSLITFLAFMSLVLLMSNFLATSEKIKRRIYKSYWGKVFISMVFGAGIVFTFKKIALPNLTFNRIEFTEDYYLLIVVFLISISLKKQKEEK